MRRWGAVVTMAIAASAACGRTASDVTGGRGGSASAADAAGGSASSSDAAGGAPAHDAGGVSGAAAGSSAGGSGGAVGSGAGGAVGGAASEGGASGAAGVPVCPAPGGALPACDWEYEPPADGLVCRRTPTADGCPVEVSCQGVIPNSQDSVSYWLWLPTTGWEGEPCPLAGQRCTTDRVDPTGLSWNGRQVFVHVCSEAGVWERELGDAATP